MNKWRLLLFSVFGLLQITTSDRNFIDGRCCEHSSRYAESDTRISIYEPYRVNRISPELVTRKSSETRPRTRAEELRSFSRRDIINRDHLRRTNDDHQIFERRDFSRERNFEDSRIKRENIQEERSVKNDDGVFLKDSRPEVASRDNYRHNDERERFGNNGLRQDDGFDYRRRFARNFAKDGMSKNRNSENNPQKRERRVSEMSRIAKRLENRNIMRQHLFNDEARKIEEIRYQSEKYLENGEVRNTRNGRFVREYRNKEDSFAENRIRSNTRSRHNKNDIVLNRLQERRISRRALTERNIRMDERVSDEHLNHRDSILGNENSIRNNRQRVAQRNLIMLRGTISEEPQRYRDEKRRERTQKNINENRIREDSRDTNREDLRRNRDLNIETRRDNYERALEKDSATIRVTRRATTMHDLRDDVRDINRENRFSQRTSQIRRHDTRLETSNMIERHIRNSREFMQIQERDRRNLKEPQNIKMIERRDNGQFKVQADASLERGVINHSEERNRVRTDDRRERNFIQDDIRQHRQQDRESSRMRSNSANRRINVNRATENIDEQLRETRLQNTQERRNRRQDRDVSRGRNISASKRYNVQNMVNGELQRIRSGSLDDRSIRRQARDISVRITVANSNDFRRNNLDEIRRVNLYSRDNRDESRKLSVRVLSNIENSEEQQRKSQPSLERLSIRQNDRNIIRSRRSDLPNRYTTSNNRENVRDEVRSGDIQNNLNRYSRDTQARQNIRRENRDESRIRSVRVLSNTEDRKERRSRSQPPLERLSIRQNDRNNLQSRFTTSNSRDDVLNEVRSGDTEKSLNRYSRDTQARPNIRRDSRDESRIRSVRVLSNTEDRKERRSRSQPPLERFSRQNDRNIIRSRRSDLPNRYTTSNNRDNVRDEVRSGDIENNLNRYSRDTQARQNIRRDNRDESRIRSVRVLKNMENRAEHRSRSQPSLERISIRQNDINILRSRSTDLPNRFTTSNSRDSVRDEVRSGDIKHSLNRYSRDTQARQNIRRENRDESRIRSVRVLSDAENRKERRSRSQPPLERFSRQNDRNILRSRSADLPNRFTTSNSRDDARDEVRSGDIGKTLSYKQGNTDVVRTRSTPISRTVRLNKNNEESRRTATQNTLRITRTGSDEFDIYSTRSPKIYISQNGRDYEASRRIRSRSLTTERRTENRQVRINRDRSLNERSTRIERDDEKRDTRRVSLIAATRSRQFAENMRDIPVTQKTKTTSYIFEMKWQYIFYALQGLYICSLFLKMPQNQGKKQLRITSWLTPVNYMKID